MLSLPRKPSSTISWRAVASRIASTTIATGLTVGWRASNLPSSPERVDARKVPHVGTVAAILPELHVVAVRFATVLEDEHRLVLAPMQRAHSAIVLDPNAPVLQLFFVCQGEKTSFARTSLSGEESEHHFVVMGLRIHLLV